MGSFDKLEDDIKGLGEVLRGFAKGDPTELPEPPLVDAQTSRFAFTQPSAGSIGIGPNVFQAAINKLNTLGGDRVNVVQIWEPNSVIDLTTISTFINMRNFIVHSIHFSGNIVESLKPLMGLTALNIQNADNRTKWDATPLFNYWAANGKTGRVNFYIDATAVVNGETVDIAFNTNVIFEGGSWTIQ